MTAEVVVHLVRHGQTTSYDADSGLTPLGRTQAAQRGRTLAEQLGPADLLGVEHAPTLRARETAQVLRDSFAAAHGVAAGELPPLEEAPDFRNLGALVDGRWLEPTVARALIPPDVPTDGSGPGWAVEATRFWAAHEDAGDAMGFWLGTPLVWHESPREVVLRMLGAAARRCRRSARDGHVVVAAHSGCLRPVVAWAAGADPGEPDNTADVLVSVGVDRQVVTVEHQGRRWTMPLPPEGD